MVYRLAQLGGVFMHVFAACHLVGKAIAAKKNPSTGVDG
jgi:hypothetical protein